VGIVQPGTLPRAQGAELMTYGLVCTPGTLEHSPRPCPCPPPPPFPATSGLLFPSASLPSRIDPTAWPISVKRG
jgi:hypothetical protein